MIAHYLSILFSEMISLVGDTIDSGFGNSLSIGAICVFGIINSIKTVLYALYNYGIYYYRLKGDRAKAGLYISILFSLASAVIGILFHKKITLLFYLEEQYQPLLYRCTVIMFIFFVFEAICEYTRGYLIYIKKTALCIKSTTIYYVFMLLFDAIAVLKFHSAELVLVGSGLCYMGYSAAIYFLSGLSKEKYEKGDLLTVLIDGLPLFSNRIMSKVSMLLLNVFASRLGTVGYAVLSVGRRSLEIGQQCMHPLVTMNIINFRGMGLEYKEILKKSKEVIIIASGVFLVVTTTALVIIKGDLSYSQLMPVIPINILSMFVYITWMLTETKMTCDNAKTTLVMTGFVRFFITLVLCFISTVTNGMIILLLYSFISDLIVSFYAYIKTR